MEAEVVAEVEVVEGAEAVEEAKAEVVEEHRPHNNHNNHSSNRMSCQQPTSRRWENSLTPLMEIEPRQKTSLRKSRGISISTKT